jgi:2,4-didehydro-3-deoxy-L-rhamnonate hydrolase
MRLYTFEVKGQQRIGAETDKRLIDLRITSSANDLSTGTFTDLLSILRGGETAMRAMREAVNFALEHPGEHPTYGFDEVKLLAPIPRPGKILCSGINYASHKEENPNAKMPEEPFFFSKLPSAVIGPGAPIIIPKQSAQVDYEVEFAVVIGKTMHRVPESGVMDCIAGYTILHDVSARDIQFKENQITLGKNFDTFSPIGPCLVTRDEIPAPDNCRMRTLLNGKVMQDGSTSEWLFSLPTLLSFLSGVMTLEPGDVVSTGTPAGVGFFRNPQVFLRPGDQVSLEIEGIGKLENPVTSENRLL